MSDLSALVPSDEMLNHQIVQTFASVAQSDLSWTERVWGSASARDGSLQLSFGLGKYTNRGVLDAFAGVSRGSEQWTVRASRMLSPNPDDTSVGPIRYEVQRPLSAVRFTLEPNEHVPIAFDYVIDGVLPASLEHSWPVRSQDGYRLMSDHLRFHQVGLPYGWVEVEGVRTTVGPEAWVAFRDRSWGVRPASGAPGDPGLPPHNALPMGTSGVKPPSMTMFWLPMLCWRQDGSAYGLFAMYLEQKQGGWESREFQAAQDGPTGERVTFRAVRPHLHFQDDNRRFLGGIVELSGHDGAERNIEVTPISDTGFHLGTGLYGGYGGHYLGEWRGELHVEGDHVFECDTPAVARRLHQLRDVLVRVNDPVGGGTGFGNIESIVTGGNQEMGLTDDASFR